jgi:hypothetical protein
MATGYVKLHRESMDHPVFDDPWLWKVFTWCIMRANFADSQYKDGPVERGSFKTGRNAAAESLNASKKARLYFAKIEQALDNHNCMQLHNLSKR